MYINLQKLFNNEGFIIKIENNGYGENFQFNPYQKVDCGDVFLFSNIKEYVLVKIINNNEYKIIGKEKANSKENYLFSLIKNGDFYD